MIKRAKGQTDDQVRTSLAELTDEAALAGSFSHPNVVRLHAVASVGRPSMRVCFELCALGSLEKLLHSEADQHVTVAEAGIPRLIGYLIDTAAGMAYLAELGCVHRDLAARNILISAQGVAKIADFGMARRVGQNADYEMMTSRQLPARWLAPEALLQGHHSSQSDVWSFGVTIWETMSLGKPPFPQEHDWRLLVDKVSRGLRLDRPSGCPDAIHSMMLSCWNLSAAARPTFAQLKTQLMAEHRQLVVAAQATADGRDGGVAGPHERRTRRVRSAVSPAQLSAEIDAWIKADIGGKAAETALQADGHRPGAFCFRASSSSLGDMVLCVRLLGSEIGRFRVRLSVPGTVELLDVKGHLPSFSTLLECVQYLMVPGREHFLGVSLHICIPLPGSDESEL